MTPIRRTRLLVALAVIIVIVLALWYLDYTTKPIPTVRPMLLKATRFGGAERVRDAEGPVVRNRFLGVRDGIGTAAGAAPGDPDYHALAARAECRPVRLTALREAPGILSEVFPDRPVVGIHAVDLAWGSARFIA